MRIDPKAERAAGAYAFCRREDRRHLRRDLQILANKWRGEKWTTTYARTVERAIRLLRRLEGGRA